MNCGTLISKACMICGALDNKCCCLNNIKIVGVIWSRLRLTLIRLLFLLHVDVFAVPRSNKGFFFFLFEKRNWEYWHFLLV